MSTDGTDLGHASRDGALPGWITRLRALTALLGVSVGGYTFIDNPVAFIETVILRRLRDFVLGAAGEAGARMIQLSQILIDSTVGVIGPAISNPAAKAGDAIIGLVEVINGLAVEAGTLAGPASIIVIPLVYAASLTVIAAVVVGIWRAYQWIRVVVV